MNNFRKYWEAQEPSLVSPWPWEIRAGDIGLESKSSIKEMVGVIDSGLVGSCMRGVLEGEFLIISRSWLTLGGEVPPVSARPCQSIKNTTNKKTCLEKREEERFVFPFIVPYQASG